MTGDLPDIPDLFDLRGRVALITGGSRGLGREIALAFARNGADVVIASRKIDACDSVAREVRERTGRRTWAAQFHAGNWDDAERLAEHVYHEAGRCDVLVNNAGIAPAYSSLAGVSEALFDKTLAVNVKGPFRLSALIGERMAADSGGAIINMSSMASIVPKPHQLVYASAKAALNALTLGLAHAYAPKVRSNAILAGPFLTDISRAWDMDAFQERARATIPLGRGGRPDEIVGAALYLASDASSYTTGALLRVDGGAALAPT